MNALTNFLTEPEIRAKLREAVQDRTLTEAANEMGVTLPFLSMAVNGAPVTGKILRYLGFERVRERLYRKRSHRDGDLTGKL
jgi:hypothetical protein